MQTATQPMVKASELRVGNWVYIQGSIIQLTGPKLAFIFEEDGLITRCNPIPLSPELLEKCGFVKYTQEDMRLYLNNGYLWFMYDSCGHCIEVNDLAYDTHESDIKFLHQLQNLYFALTGEELEINF